MRFVPWKIGVLVILSRKTLRGTGIVIVKDLSLRGSALLCNLKDDAEVGKLAWSVNEKIYMKALDGMIVQVKGLSDLCNSDSRVRWTQGNQP